MASPQGRSAVVAEDDIEPGVLPRKFTKEELAVLNECSLECMIYRCAPLSVVFLGTTHFLLKVGYLTPHPKYGSLFKNFAALFGAYVVGKISYQNTCRHKILTKIPESRLARALAAKMNVALPTPKPAEQESEGDTFLGQQPSYDLDTNRSSLQMAKGLDDNYRPSMDREILGKRTEDLQSTEYTSYNDLRRQNRMAFDKPQRERPLDKTPGQRTEPTPWTSKEPTTAGKKKNIYGDVWDE